MAAVGLIYPDLLLWFSLQVFSGALLEKSYNIVDFGRIPFNYLFTWGKSIDPRRQEREAVYEIKFSVFLRL
jgi:hypothetical protein